MEYAKQWLSLEEQADLLIGKGLVCRREDLVARLSEVGFYRLSAYWFPYKVKRRDGDSVLVGAHLDSIWETYLLDCDLRTLMFSAVARIEIYLRSQLAYFASSVSGPFGYPENSLRRLRREYAAAQKSELFMRHFADTYGDSHQLPPYWVMVEASTMGTIEALYRDAEPEVRIVVATNLGVRVPVFKNWLSVLRVARNACCHHSRIWNRVWGVRPVIPKDWGEVSFENDRTFAVLTVLNHMLSCIDPDNGWVNEVEALLARYSTVAAERKMGFPEEWKGIPGWKSDGKGRSGEVQERMN